jgi:hypothetical protein
MKAPFMFEIQHRTLFYAGVGAQFCAAAVKHVLYYSNCRMRRAT